MEPGEDKDLKIGEHGTLSGSKDKIQVKSVLGILLAIVGAIFVYYVLSAITVAQGSASDPKVLSQAGADLPRSFSRH